MVSLYRRCLDFVSHTINLMMSSGSVCSIPDLELPPINQGEDASLPDSIENWSWHVLNLYTSLEVMRGTKIIRLDWYKYFQGVEHEYVVATVLRNNHQSYLRFERRAADEMIVDEKNILKEENTQAFSTSDSSRFRLDVLTEKNIVKKRNRWDSVRRSSHKISSKDNLPIAADTITHVLSPKGVIYDDSGTVNHLASYEFSSRHFYLRDLALILRHIHATSPAHTLLLEQCFWFAYTCIGVAIARWDPVETCTPRRRIAGTYEVVKSAEPAIIGDRTRIPVNNDNPQQINEFGQDLDIQIQEHNQIIVERYMNGEGGRIQAEQVADDERRQKEWALKRADDERQQKEEEIQELKARVASLTLDSSDAH